MDTSSWKQININKIFDISYGNKLDMCQMMPNEKGIPFVTRTATNNGVGGIVEPIDGIMPYPAGSLSIALGGSIGSTFLQTKDFYTSQNVAVLQPKFDLNNGILLFLAKLIEKECSQRFVAFGRELNKHIKRDFYIKLPLVNDNMPNWPEIDNIVKDQIIPLLPKKVQRVWMKKYDIQPKAQSEFILSTDQWHKFNVGILFEPLQKCKCSNATELLEDGDDIMYIGAKKSGNGVMQKVKRVDALVTKGNCIVFIGDGQGSVGYCLYQPSDFIGSTTLVAGYNDSLNPYVAMFLITILDKERYRYSFGRKYSKNTIANSFITLPAIKNADGEYEPDWQFMEDYIKSLPFSRNIEPSKPNEVVDELMEVKKRVIEMQNQLAAQQQANINNYGTVNIYEK